MSSRKRQSKKQRNRNEKIVIASATREVQVVRQNRKAHGVSANYDAATVNRRNERHWGNASPVGMTADQINNPATRATLKQHSKYECGNAGYLKRAIRKIPIEVVGTEININLKSADEKFVKDCERDLKEWKTCIGLESQLRVMWAAKIVDGESIALPVSKPRVGRKNSAGIQLDLMVLSCDRLTTKSLQNDNNNIDGVHLDNWLDPVEYEIAETNTDYFGSICTAKTKKYKAENVYHLFEKIDPEAHRGIPELTSTLELNAKKRNYTDSVVSAARNAADMSAVIEQDVQGDHTVSTPGEEIPLDRDTVITLGPNQKLHQINASQPVDTYDAFSDNINREGLSPTGLPTNVVKSDSSDMNFSSSRFDYFIMWGKDRDTFRKDMEFVITRDFIWRAIREWAALKNRRIPDDLILTFAYDVDKYINPVQEVTAKIKETTRNEQGIALSSMQSILQPQGKEWKEDFTQQADEELFMYELRKERGLIRDDNGANNE